MANHRVSKAELRGELARLRSANADNNTLLDAISSPDTTTAELDDIVRRLTGGQSRFEVASLITQRPTNKRQNNGNTGTTKERGLPPKFMRSPNYPFIISINE